mgnify:CR=1 FL=1
MCVSEVSLRLPRCFLCEPYDESGLAWTMPEGIMGAKTNFTGCVVRDGYVGSSVCRLAAVAFPLTVTSEPAHRSRFGPAHVMSQEAR